MQLMQLGWFYHREHILRQDKKKKKKNSRALRSGEGATRQPVVLAAAGKGRARREQGRAGSGL